MSSDNDTGYYPIMAIGDNLVSQVISKLPEEVAKEVLMDLNTDGFKVIVQQVNEHCAQLLMTVATMETGADSRQLQHTRVQTITITSVLVALAKHVQLFGEGNHPLSPAKAQPSADYEVSGAL